MSTKTNFKRIALVAVAALGLGVLSSVPSQAAVIGTLTVTPGNGTATIQKSDSSTGASLAVSYTATATGDTVAVTVVLAKVPTSAVGASDSVLVTVSDSSLATGAVPTLRSTLGAGLNGVGADSITITSAGTAAGSIVPVTNGLNATTYGKFKYHLDTALVRTAGTYTLSYVVMPYESGAGVTTKAVSGSMTITVTDGTAAAAGSVSAGGTSTAVLSDDGTPTTAGVDDVLALLSTPSTSPRAYIKVTQLTSAGDPARESITATINVGNLGQGGSALGKSIVLLGNANGINTLEVYSDGSSGEATITLKTTSVTFANKSITFYSDTVKEYKITQLATVIGSGSSGTFLVKAMDATGNQIKETANTTVYAYSSNLDAISTGGATTTTGTACAGYLEVYGGHVCSFAGSANGEATITIRNKSTVALSTVSATAGKVTVNTNAPVKIALAFDKATYAPGEVAYLTVSATDAAGNAVAPSTGYTNMLATGGITSNVAFGNGSAVTDSMTATTLPFNTATTGKASSTGVYTVKLYMPVSGGNIEAYVTGGTALAGANQVKLTAKAAVTDNGAAALAAVNALATTVASLKTLITTLTNLVLKIQKKVKA